MALPPQAVQVAPLAPFCSTSHPLTTCTCRSAVAAGRSECAPEDLEVLRYLTAFRVPEEVHTQHVQKAIDEVADVARRAREAAANAAGGGAGSGGGDDGGGGSGTKAGGKSGDGKADDPNLSGGGGSAGGQAQQQLPPKPTHERAQQTAAERQQQQQLLDDDDDDDDDGKKKRKQREPSLLMKALAPLFDLLPKPQPPPPPVNVDAESVEGLNRLLLALEGQFERSTVTRASHSDGVPRGWRRLRSFDGFADDADHAEAAAWCAAPATGTLPRAVDRTKPRRGGALAILRDVSTSMHGVNAKYASSLALRVIELARRRKMRVGLLEYSDEVRRPSPGVM